MLWYIAPSCYLNYWWPSVLSFQTFLATPAASPDSCCVFCNWFSDCMDAFYSNTVEHDHASSKRLLKRTIFWMHERVLRQHRWTRSCQQKSITIWLFTFVCDPYLKRQHRLTHTCNQKSLDTSTRGPYQWSFGLLFQTFPATPFTIAPARIVFLDTAFGGISCFMLRMACCANRILAF